MISNEKIPPYHIFFLIVGSLIGPGFLKMSNFVVSIAKQDAWISAIIALIYPYAIILFCIYIVNNSGDEDILLVTKRHFGKYLGTLLFIIFFFQFPYFLVSVAGDLVIIVSTYVAGFLTPLKIVLVAFIVSLYTSTRGIQSLAKMNEITFYLLIFLITLSLFSFKNISLLNIKPVLGTDIKDILVAATKTPYFYLGPEVLLIFHSYMYSKEKVAKWSLLAITAASIIWVGTTILSILYLGIDIIQKSYIPFIFVYESINIKVINNFMYIFIFVWSFVIYKTLANYMFMTNDLLYRLTSLKPKILIIILTPIFFYFSIILSKNKIRVKVTDIVPLIYVIFNFIYMLCLVLIMYFKKKSLKKEV